MTGIATAVMNLLLNGFVYAVFLKDFYETHPAVSESFSRQLSRPPEQLVIWAMVATSLAFGFFITTMIAWSGARDFRSGLKYGFILAFLFWSSVNFGLYASSNFFSRASLFADLFCSVAIMTFSGAIAAWISGKFTSGNKNTHHPLFILKSEK